MMDQDWVLLTKVPDLIMRGALVARLGDKQIEVYVPERDAIVNVGSAPNLSLEGYSALFDGYHVYVPRRSLTQAKSLLAEFEKEVWPQDPVEKDSAVVDHTFKFYFAAALSWIAPVVLHVVAAYHFIQALRKKQTWSYAKLSFSIFILGISGTLAFYVLIRALRDLI